MTTPEQRADVVGYLRAYGTAPLQVAADLLEADAAEIARLKDRLDIRRGDDGDQADEIDRLTFQLSQLQFHKDDVDATNRRLRAEVIPLQKRLAELTDDNAKWKATAGELKRQRDELEVLVREVSYNEDEEYPVGPGWFNRARSLLHSSETKDAV